jgi:hypothetical protein
LLHGCTPDVSTVEDVPEQVLKTEEVISRRGRSRAVEVPIHSKWDFPPEIILCYGAAVTENRVSEAVSFWENLGYEFGTIRQLSQLEVCQPAWGTITFRLPTGSELSAAINADHMATTRYSSLIEMPEVLVMSEIYFQTSDVSPLPRVVEHELGHALGWRHITVSGHLMHPIYRKSGTGTEGLHVENYQYSQLKSRK